MKKQLLMLLAAAAMAGLTGGCFEMNVDITVAPDGSGTITQTIYVRKDLSDAAASKGAETKENTLLEGMMSPAETAKVTKSFGEGVTLSSVKKVKADDGRDGVQIVMAFADVTKLGPSMTPSLPGADEGMDHGSQQPNMSLPFLSGGSDRKKAMKIEFVKAADGKPAKLTLAMPKPDFNGADKSASQPAQTPEQEAQEKAMTAMMAQMLEGMKMTMTIHVKGAVSKSNASLPLENGLTLLSADIGALVTNEAMTKKIKSIKDVEAAKKLMADPEIKKVFQVELNPKIEVEFK